MRRMHLIEIHDQNWFPGFLREQVTDYLQVLLNLVRAYQPIAHRLREALESAGSDQVLDLCSGAGGPWSWLCRALERDGLPPIDVCLTDYYPHAKAFNRARVASHSRIHFLKDPVDARRVPAGLYGFRTFFSSFHHFPPGEARAILQDAVDHERGIGIFEVPGRYALTFLLVCLIPIATLLIAPFVRPFNWSRLIWTYLIPVVPLVLVFDGIVSCLRIYSPRELRELTGRLSADGYHWDIGVEKKLGRASVTYLIGYPTSITGKKRLNAPGNA
jgi:hypothetical protein